VEYRGKVMRRQIASMIIELSYDKEKSVKIRRLPGKHDIEELKKPKYMLIEEEGKVSDNQIELRMFYNPKRKDAKVKSGGIHDYGYGDQYGIDIDVKMKHPEEQLNGYLCKLIRQLCKKHLKPCVLFPSRYSISCQIDNCLYDEENVKDFLEGFVKTIKDSTRFVKITGIKEKIDEDIEVKIRKDEERLGLGPRTTRKGEPTEPKTETKDKPRAKVRIDTKKIKKRHKWKTALIGIELILIFLLGYFIGQVIRIP
jgi:hypothetical protein